MGSSRSLENRYIGLFATTACIDGLGRTLATIAGGGNGPSESYSVTPVNRSGPTGDPGGVCTVTVTDALGNSAPVTITVGPTAAPPPSGGSGSGYSVTYTVVSKVAVYTAPASRIRRCDRRGGELASGQVAATKRHSSLCRDCPPL